MNIRYNFKHILITIISVENIQVFSILHKIVSPPKSDLRSLSTFIFPNVQNEFPVGIHNTEKGDSPKLNLSAKKKMVYLIGQNPPNLCPVKKISTVFRNFKNSFGCFVLYNKNTSKSRYSK